MTPSSADLLPRVIAGLRQRAGLKLDRHATGRVGELLDDRLAISGGPLPADPVDDAPFFHALVDALTIDETYFFRHRHQLDHLRRVILPALLAARPPGHVLQLWSAGCANGAEPYTLAMILVEEGLAARSHVLGTDISAAAIEQARRARFSRWTRRSTELASRQHLFSAPTSTWATLSPEVTDRVTLRQHNLLDQDYPRVTGGGFDVILCRNVLLHLTPEAAAAVAPRLVDALAPGGWLITAPADPPVLGLVAPGDLRPVTLPGGGLVHQRTAGDDPAGPVAPGPARHRAPRPRQATRPGRPQHSADEPSTVEMDGRRRCEAARDLLAAGDAVLAMAEASAAVVLAPDLAMAHLTLGMAAQQAGRQVVAAREFQRASQLLGTRDPDEAVELAEGETAGSLAELARAHALLASEHAGGR